MLMITTTTTMTKYVLLTSRGHVEISRFDDKSLQVMEYIEYICVSVFTYAYFTRDISFHVCTGGFHWGFPSWHNGAHQWNTGDISLLLKYVNLLPNQTTVASF